MSDNQSEFWEGVESEFFSEFGEEALTETVPATQIKPKTASSRRILNIIFVVDVSGSMRGTRIGQVNYALENIFKELRNRDDINSIIKVALMQFSEDAEWKTPTPILLDDFVFTPITVIPSCTYYGKAFDALESKMHKNGFMDPNLGEYFAPLILFISDGEPTDIKDYPVSLDRLNSNAWFKKAARYAVAVGEEAKTEKIGNILSQFTGNRKNVRYADEGAGLCDLIEFIAVRASEVQTSMVSSSWGKTEEENQSIFAKEDASLFSSLFNG